MNHWPNPLDPSWPDDGCGAASDGAIFEDAGLTYIAPNAAIDREARLADIREGVSCWKWACRDAATGYKRRKAAARTNDAAEGRYDHVVPMSKGAAMARADRQAREFAVIRSEDEMNREIRFGEEVRRRIGRRARRAERWERLKRLNPWRGLTATEILLVLTITAVGAAAALWALNLFGCM